MFFTCKDSENQEHELVFVRWNADANDCPKLFTDRASPMFGVQYLRWQPAAVGIAAATALYPRYGVVELEALIRAVYIQPDFAKASLAENRQRFFLNKYLRCDP